MYNNKKNIFCNNCGKIGHLFHQCKIPITSIGVIAIRNVDDFVEVLMICRKDSLSFVDFMRGKYNLEDSEYIINLLEKMTVIERNRLLKENFDELWKYLWGDNEGNLYKIEEKNSRHKFEKLKEGYIIDNNNDINLETLISKCKNHYLTPEWGFPKGRRNYQEKDIMCGLREFEEETGYNKTNLLVINNILPVEEIFTGSNYKSYKHKYYLSYIKNNVIPEHNFQAHEISKIEWFKLSDAIESIRDYNIEKKNVLIQINNLLKSYKVYI